MNCRDFDAALPDFVGHELPYITRAACRDHMAGCPTCRRDLETYRTTIALAQAAYESERDRLARETRDRILNSVLAERG